MKADRSCESCGAPVVSPWRRCEQCLLRSVSDREDERLLARSTRLGGGTRPYTPADWLSGRGKGVRGRKLMPSTSREPEIMPDEQNGSTTYHGGNYGDD